MVLFIFTQLIKLFPRSLTKLHPQYLYDNLHVSWHCNYIFGCVTKKMASLDLIFFVLMFVVCICCMWSVFAVCGLYLLYMVCMWSLLAVCDLSLHYVVSHCQASTKCFVSVKNTLYLFCYTNLWYGLYLSQIVCVYQIQSMFVRRVCVCHRQSLFVTDNQCLSAIVFVFVYGESKTVCVCHIQYVSVTDSLYL